MASSTSSSAKLVISGLRLHFARQENTGPIRLYRIGDVTLDASLMLLLRRRSRITETRHHVTDEEYAATLVKPLMATTHDPANHYVICCNRTWHNYYHWLIQTVPAIESCRPTITATARSCCGRCFRGRRRRSICLGARTPTG